MITSLDRLGETPNLQSLIIEIERLTQGINIEDSVIPIILPTYDVPLNALVTNNQIDMYRKPLPCYHWDGFNCSSKFKDCHFDHSRGKDTRQSNSRERNNESYRNNDRNRQTDMITKVQHCSSIILVYHVYIFTCVGITPTV